MHTRCFFSHFGGVLVGVAEIVSGNGPLNGQDTAKWLLKIILSRTVSQER